MGEPAIATTGTKTKKRNVFKRIGKGLSRRKKKKNHPDDESTYSVGSVGATGAGSRSSAFANTPHTIPENGDGSSSSLTANPARRSALATPIRLVLLLMDPNSRRFELLQLEFDSSQALVSDVLRQIRCSATETALRDMNYVGVCDQSGMEMIASVKLSRFCQGAEIVLAMPHGMTANDTTKLAGPILDDSKVKDMLAPSGVKVRAQTLKNSRSAMAGGGRTKLAEIAEDFPQVSFPPRTDKEGSGSVGGGKKAAETPSSSILPTAMLGILIFSLLFFAAQRHTRVTKPIESGDVLLRGQWKSQCGILDLFPEEWLAKLPLEHVAFSCNISSSPMLELGRDGTLRYFTKGDEDERQERWSATGGQGLSQCAEGGEEEDEEEEQCSGKGATFREDGNAWFVEMEGSRLELNKDVIRDFISER